MTTNPTATMMPAPVMKYCSAGGTFGITGLPSRELSENEANDNDRRQGNAFRRLLQAPLMDTAGGYAAQSLLTTVSPHAKVGQI